ncbi:response regulator transcription factor [Taibaiella soli]|uniref:response regulator transcription factor n=1 Tax=Taibaiella soli TaxID=1649169 RepID=UPI001401E1A8|nr:response regulator transcription factor [Taibaiella soli]
MKNRPISIGIADEHVASAERLGRFMAEQSGYEVSFCANDGEKLISLFGRRPTDYVVVHLFLPFLSGIEAIQMIRKQNESVFIIACSFTYQEDIALMLSKLGNVLYCERRAEVICDFLMHGERREPITYDRYVEQWKTKSNAYSLPAEFKSKKEYPFTNTDLRVIALVSSGHTNCEIAELLGKSKRTIDTYIDRMIRGLGLNGRTGLASYAYEHGVCKLYCEAGKNKRCCRDSIFNPVIDDMDWGNID